MGLPKGSKLEMFYFYTFSLGLPDKQLFSFKCTRYNLKNNIINVCRKASVYNDILDCRCDWRRPLVVTDIFKRPIYGPFDFSRFLDGDF